MSSTITTKILQLLQDSGLNPTLMSLLRMSLPHLTDEQKAGVFSTLSDEQKKLQILNSREKQAAEKYDVLAGRFGKGKR